MIKPSRNGNGAAASITDAEIDRLKQTAERTADWKRWGPYLSERQWATVREDYSATGECWDYFPHDHARSRAYRWGEDGLLGITDRQCRLCFSVALWNGKDRILKERLFGLTGPEGNHGEDVKELYYYLDSTPTHSYLKALYKYPQAEFPYAWLADENRRRNKQDPEFELLDTGVFNDNRYFDVTAEYAKASPNDVLIRLTIANRGSEAATVHVLPTVWFRNTWSWGRSGEGYWPKPKISRMGELVMALDHASLGKMRLIIEPVKGQRAPQLLFTDNETNAKRLFGSENTAPHVKDAFHEYIINGRTEAVNPDGIGTKAAADYLLAIPAGQEIVVKLRLIDEQEFSGNAFGASFDRVFDQRITEADGFYASRVPATATKAEASVIRQGYAGLLWSKQYFHYSVKDWLEGDTSQPTPPESRKLGRNNDWAHLYNRDIISMPDKWEYPWYAAWDLAFHMLPFSKIDPDFTKEQLVLFLREWYMHPNGQLPAYEFAFSDVNPPVHAWACWRAYKISGPKDNRDRLFLSRVFQKLLVNFTWWVNRKDLEGKHLFAGGFLGLDNIGVFDRSKPLPNGGHLEQADGTAWMAFYCATMLSMALELSKVNPAYEDIASKFFEHFIAITDAINTLGGSGLWDEQDGFYYDQLHVDGMKVPLRIRSLVGLIPLLAVEILEEDVIDRLPGFKKRMEWFLEHRRDLSQHIAYMEEDGSEESHGHRLLAIPSKQRLTRVLRYLLDEKEFLSPYGIRSLSKVHEDRPFAITLEGQEQRVEYTPGESTTGLFGGNSNWRGPIWFPVNYLLIEALERYHHFYGEQFKVECPTGSGCFMTLQQVATELNRRHANLFLPDASGRRACHGNETRYAKDPHWRDLVLFSEYFHGDTGRGVGASHQTGWTSLAIRCIEDVARSRRSAAGRKASSKPALAEVRR